MGVATVTVAPPTNTATKVTVLITALRTTVLPRVPPVSGRPPRVATTTTPGPRVPTALHDSRYGKSYDAVHAKSYNEQNYNRHTQADDDRWAVDEDSGYDHDDYGYGNDASASAYRAPQAWGRTY